MTEILDEAGETVRRHPYLILGSVAGVVVLFLVLSNRKGAAPSDFKFSYGPSDAQVLAGTQLAIAQAANQTDISKATIGATTAKSYFDLLSNTSANAKAADLGIAQIQSNTALGTAGYAVQTAGINAQAASTIAGIQGSRDVQIAGLASNTSIANTAAQYGSANYIAGVNAATARQGNALLAQTSQSAALLDAQTRQYIAGTQLAATQDTNAANVRISTSQDYTSGVLATINQNAAVAMNATNAYQSGVNILLSRG